MILPDRGPGPERAIGETAPLRHPAGLRAEAGTSALPAGLPGAVPGTDFVTMAEAARIKGVSYHTVSRAVRHGRLPVERVGRMALIAVPDLQAWRPMTERRPRRYQHPQPASAAGFGLQAGGLDAATRFAEMSARILADAAALPLDSFLARCAERLAADLGCPHCSIWSVSPEDDATISLSLATQVQMGSDGWFVSSRLGLPRTITLTPDGPIADCLENASAQMVATAEVASDGIFSAAERILIAPLRAGGHPTGLLIAESVHGAVSEVDLRVLDHLLEQVAFGWTMIRERSERDRRIQVLEAALDAAPVGIRLREGEQLQYRNRQDRTLFQDGSALAAMLGDDLAQLADHGEQNGSFSLQDAQGHCVDVDLGWIPTDATSGGVRRSIVISQDQSEQVAERDRDERAIRGLRRDVARARAVSDLSRKVQGVTAVANVIQRGVPSLIAAIEGDGALVKVRDPQRGLERIPFGEGDVSALIPTKVNSIAYPSAVLAFARRQPVLVTRYTATTFEREAMEHARWRSMLVVPLLVKDEQLGFVMVGYADDTQVDRNVVVLAGELAQVLAEAIVVTRMHERLSAELRQVLDVLDQVPQAVLISQGSEGVVSYANLAAKQLWQWADDARPRTLQEFPMLDGSGLPFDDDVHPLTTGMRTGRPLLGVPLTIRSFTGDEIEVMGTIAPVEGPAGVVTGTVAILQDRSQLRRLDEAKEAFVAMVAHELRNPLTSVVGNVQLLERHIARDPASVSPDIMQRVETVGRQVGVLSGLVSRLLDRSRLEFAQLDIQPVPTDAVALVERACGDTEPLLDGHVLRLVTPSRLPVTWDEVRMGQVLANLLANAARYGEGEIDIRVEIIAPAESTAGESVRLVIRDHGPGFAADERTHLFSPHVRIDEGYGTPMSESRGLGIGLYLSERIVSAHGGTITVANAADEEGGGAVVTIEVPTVAAAASVRAEGRAYRVG